METTQALRRLLAGEDLGREEIESLVGRLMDDRLSDPLKAALLVALAAKGESPEEIAGAAAAMRRRLVPVPHHQERAVDTCGTGGDASGTFNLSTAAALVAAGGGATVAKHGNRSVSSRSGSADVLAELGVRIELDPAAAGRCLDQVGIAFLFAPRLHPAMRAVMPVRRELGVRTLFNLLGPLTNPAGARRQLLGVYAAELVRPMAEVLLALGSEHALVVHGSGGLDEITTTGPTSVAEVRNGKLELYELEPQRFALPRRRLAELAGGDPRHNAGQMRRLLAGGETALAEAVVLNAGAALYVAGISPEIGAGVDAARESLASGAAAAKLEALVQFTQQAAEAAGGRPEAAGGRPEAAG